MHKTKDTDTVWLTSEEVAAILPISKSWLEKLRRDGSGGPPYYKKNPVNGKSAVRYKKHEVEQWFERGRIDPKVA